MVKLSKQLDLKGNEELKGLLEEYKDIFAWSYKDTKGIYPKFYHHIIDLKEDVVPIKQQ